MPPIGDMRESWHWLGELAAGARGGAGNGAPAWQNLDAIIDAMVAEFPELRGVREAAPNAAFRINGLRVPRKSIRESGRTAVTANIDLHEPRPAQDPDSPLSYTMEGLGRGAPPALFARFWSPGWNSDQSLNKFQSEVGGQLVGGDPGVRLVEAPSRSAGTYFAAIPAAPAARDGLLLLVPRYHVFGSEELSVLVTRGGRAVPERLHRSFPQRSGEPWAGRRADRARHHRARRDDGPDRRHQGASRRRGRGALRQVRPDRDPAPCPGPHCEEAAHERCRPVDPRHPRSPGRRPAVCRRDDLVRAPAPCAFSRSVTDPTGPGPFGVLQVVADMLKIFTKENWIPPFAEKAVFVIAPSIIMITTLASFAVIPIAPAILVSDLDVGLLFFLAMSSFAVYSVALAGWASNNKYSLLGSIRAVGQMVSYEVFMGLSLMGVVLMAGSFSLQDIVTAQKGMWYVVPQFVGFVVFFIAGLAETRRIPFDLPEAESELVAGYHTEYSGFKFAMFYVGEYIGITLISMMIVTLFFGGWQGPYLPPIVWFLVKTLAFVAFFILVRSALPRPRYDQLLAFGWKLMLPLALVNLAVTGGIVLAVGR